MNLVACDLVMNLVYDEQNYNSAAHYGKLTTLTQLFLSILEKTTHKAKTSYWTYWSICGKSWTLLTKL